MHRNDGDAEINKERDKMTAMHPQVKARHRQMKSVEADRVGVWTRIKRWMPKLN